MVVIEEDTRESWVWSQGTLVAHITEWGGTSGRYMGVRAVAAGAVYVPEGVLLSHVHAEMVEMWDDAIHRIDVRRPDGRLAATWHLHGLNHGPRWLACPVGPRWSSRSRACPPAPNWMRRLTGRCRLGGVA